MLDAGKTTLLNHIWNNREGRRLAAEGRFDYLLIESTGISELLPVAATFDFRDEAGQSLADAAKLDTMVTVVDAANLLTDYSSFDFLRDRGESLGGDDNRTIANLLVEQIEFADMEVLNKISTANLTTADVHFGRGRNVLLERERIKHRTLKINKTRRLLDSQNAA